MFLKITVNVVMKMILKSKIGFVIRFMYYVSIGLCNRSS